MTESTTTTPPASLAFPPGTPNWIDNSSPDVSASRAFYTGLFGWSAMDLPEEDGGYVMFTIGDRVVAATGPLQEGGFPAWSVYFNTADAEATAARVTQAGGKVVVPPFDVMDQGRMAVFADPSGAFFAAWQPKVMPGLGVKDEVNSFAWCELNTGDVDGSAEFYTAVFGWAAHRPETSSEAMQYTEWQVEGKSFGGARELTAGQGMPPSWLVYFLSADLDAAVTRVGELGGAVHMPPTPYPGGRFAVVADPVGCSFGLLASA